MGYDLKQSQTAQPLVFLLVSSTDHIAGLTGATPTVTVSKNGGTFASPLGTVSEIGSGWYKVAGNATDSGTLGPLLLHATATGADPCDERYHVVAYDPLTATNLGLSALPTAAPAASGGLPTLGTGSGQLNPSGGKLPATLAAGDVTGNVAADLQTIKTQTVTCSGGVTVPAATLASTTNITAGTITTVTTTTTATNLTNLPSIPANWLTAAGIAAAALNGKGDWLAPTVAGRTLDVSATGEAGVDWANVGGATTTVNLSGTTVGTATTLTNAPADTAGTTTLLARLTATRAGYLDNLNPPFLLARGTVATGTSATSFTATIAGSNLLATSGAYSGRTVLFQSGALATEPRTVTSYTVSGGTATFDHSGNPFTSAPAAGDTFFIG